jgi:hypothetical protein
VLEHWCGVVEAGPFAKVSGLHMHVTLVGSLRGNVPGLVFCFCFIIVVCCASMDGGRGLTVVIDDVLVWCDLF